MCSVTECEDVNGTAKFCVPWAVSLEQFAINSARQQFVFESVQGVANIVREYVFLRFLKIQKTRLFTFF